MSSRILLKAINISKSYWGNSHRIGILKHALFKAKMDTGDEFKVLENICIEIFHGETLGIMGRNGAGKTTLLGILGNVIQPTSGSVERNGKIATLLGLTAGFNHNFTGRENAYMFCSIQGISRIKADSVISKIEEFADLGRYFDAPLNTYSSGMQARLAFSCAIHVEADLIIIDETLAVGDANFRMKCYERIRSMKDDGQSFLLVSHNPDLVANFCTRAIVLEGGAKVFDGSTFEAVEVYKQLRTDVLKKPAHQGIQLKVENSKNLPIENDVSLENIIIIDPDPENNDVVIIRAELKAKINLDNLTVNFSLRNSSGIVVCSYLAEKSGFLISKIFANQKIKLEFKFLRRFLPGKYFVTFGISQNIGDVIKPVNLMQNVLSFDIQGESFMGGIADFGMQISVI